MYDRPTLESILEALSQHLESEVLPALSHDPKRTHDIRIALDLLAMAERERRDAAEHLHAEWGRLNFIQGVERRAPADLAAGLTERNRDLCDDIHEGKYDTPLKQAMLFEHLLAVTRAQLEVANPAYLSALAAEEHGRKS